MTTAAEAAIELHVQRLVDAHGLDEPTARSAVDAYRRGERGEHHELVHGAAFEVLAALQGQNLAALLAAVRAVAERCFAALRPILQTSTVGQPEDFGLVPVIEVDQPAAPPARPDRRRPAWQSPYGPPPRRSRGR
ncbi:hypothetical protein ACFW20_07135 [Streptomyces nigra]|uniref:hypothetical protein n=1 Tax=Streptomyces nigra TaxID=1827580 RepID=UPI0036A9B640